MVACKSRRGASVASTLNSIGLLCADALAAMAMDSVITATNSRRRRDMRGSPDGKKCSPQLSTARPPSASKTSISCIDSFMGCAIIDGGDWPRLHMTRNLIAFATLVFVVIPVHARPAYKQALAQYFGAHLPKNLNGCKTCHLGECHRGGGNTQKIMTRVDGAEEPLN